MEDFSNNLVEPVAQVAVVESGSRKRFYVTALVSFLIWNVAFLFFGRLCFLLLIFADYLHTSIEEPAIPISFLLAVACFGVFSFILYQSSKLLKVKSFKMFSLTALIFILSSLAVIALFDRLFYHNFISYGIIAVIFLVAFLMHKSPLIRITMKVFSGIGAAFIFYMMLLPHLAVHTHFEIENDKTVYKNNELIVISGYHQNYLPVPLFVDANYDLDAQLSVEGVYQPERLLIVGGYGWSERFFSISPFEVSSFEVRKNLFITDTPEEMKDPALSITPYGPSDLLVKEGENTIVLRTFDEVEEFEIVVEE